jgi:hypothetical protein
MRIESGRPLARNTVSDAARSNRVHNLEPQFPCKGGRGNEYLRSLTGCEIRLRPVKATRNCEDTILWYVEGERVPTSEHPNLFTVPKDFRANQNLGIKLEFDARGGLERYAASWARGALSEISALHSGQLISATAPPSVWPGSMRFASST